MSKFFSLVNYNGQQQLSEDLIRLTGTSTTLPSWLQTMGLSSQIIYSMSNKTFSDLVPVRGKVCCFMVI